MKIYHSICKNLNTGIMWHYNIWSLLKNPGFNEGYLQALGFFHNSAEKWKNPFKILISLLQNFKFTIVWPKIASHSSTLFSYAHITRTYSFQLSHYGFIHNSRRRVENGHLVWKAPRKCWGSEWMGFCIENPTVKWNVVRVIESQVPVRQVQYFLGRTPRY